MSTSFEFRDSQIRKEQNDFSQRMNKKRAYIPQNPQTRRNFQKPAHTASKPFVAKGHDKVIAAIQKTGEVVKVFVNYLDKPIVGKIVGRDKYTISVEAMNEKAEKPMIMMLFKSAILGIIHEKPLQKKPQVESSM